MRVAIGRLRDAFERHPRHVLLLGVVAGMLLAGAPAGAAVSAAALLAVGLASRPPVALLAGVALVGGWALADARLSALDHTRLGPRLGQTTTLRATLLESPRRSPSGSVSALASLRAGPGRGERVALRSRSRGGPRWPSGVEAGTTVTARGTLLPLGPFDGWQRNRGAHAVLRLGALADTGARRGGLGGHLDGLRRRAETALATGLPAPQAALLRGMVLGDDSRLSASARQAFRRVGLSHILAASGQNVMLLAAIALPLLTAIGLGLRGRLLAVVALIVLYVPLAGAGPSIQRAGIMGAAGAVAGLAGRPASRWYALLLAAAVTLAINPRAASDAGWQLSFVAVVWILALAPRLRAAADARGLPAGLAEAAAVTAAATLGTAPLIALRFDQVSLVSLPANLLAAPLVAPLMWLGMLAVVAGAVWMPLAAIPNALAQFGLAALEWLARGASALPSASVSAGVAGAAGVAVLCALAGVAIVAPRARRPAAAMAVVVLAAALAVSRPPPPIAPHGLAVSFLDIGQGDATLIQDGGHAVLIDTGPPDGPVLERLRRAGATRLDALVVTHAQADHEGAAAAILRRIPVALLLDGAAGAPSREHRAILAAASRRGARVVAPDAGQVLRAGRIRLEVLWPHAEPAADHPGEDPNQRAIVARVTDRGLSVLLTADAESDVTGPLNLDPVDILKVAHHGSADPGLRALVARLHPRLAVIEVGAHNTYGHPTAQALHALAAVPRVLRTDRDGTVRVTLEQGRMAVARVR